MSNYFIINGYWKDDLSEFNKYIVGEYEEVCEPDDDVFYYGLSEQEIKEAIKNPSQSGLEFVITSYEIL